MNCQKYCNNCRKEIHCCIFKKGGFTFITYSDAKAIKNFTQKEYSCFVDFSTLPKKIILALRNADPSLEGGLRYSQLDSENRILRLKTKKEGRCIFLDDKGKCEIYSIRPNVCRMYPFWGLRLTNGKFKLIEHGEEDKCKLLLSIKQSKNSDSKNSSNSKNKSEDIKTRISKKEYNEFKKIFAKIEKESSNITKNNQSELSSE